MDMTASTSRKEHQWSQQHQQLQQPQYETIREYHQHQQQQLAAPKTKMTGKKESKNENKSNKKEHSGHKNNNSSDDHDSNGINLAGNNQTTIATNNNQQQTTANATRLATAHAITTTTWSNRMTRHYTSNQKRIPTNKIHRKNAATDKNNTLTSHNSKAPITSIDDGSTPHLSLLLAPLPP